jgi:para-aminobenzoate synthetase / 4-amino-4-deoxychorismate lyase
VAAFDLLETMRVDPTGTIALLDRHLARLQKSADFLSFSCPVENIRASIQAQAALNHDRVLRLLISKEGTYEIQVKPLPAAQITHLVLTRENIHSNNLMLFHKTTARGVYDRPRAGLPPDTDVILVNERGEITETTIANIAVLREGKWVTPRLDCGLLPGTMRAQLLDEGEIVEGIVPATDLISGEPIRFFNAVRGVYDIPFTPPTSPSTLSFPRQ